MPLYPNLAACGISFMHFSLHVIGAFEEIEEFWSARGVAPSRNQLLAGYSRNGKPHTAWVRWERSGACCDIFFGFEAQKLTKVPRRLKEKDFRAFLEMIRGKNVWRGVRARYAVPWSKGRPPILAIAPRVRPVSVTLEVADESGSPRMTMTFQRESGADEWLAIVEPVGLLHITKPVDDQFFQLPYEIACSLAATLRPPSLESTS